MIEALAFVLGAGMGCAVGLLYCYKTLRSLIKDVERLESRASLLETRKEQAVTHFENVIAALEEVLDAD